MFAIYFKILELFLVLVFLFGIISSLYATSEKFIKEMAYESNYNIALEKAKKDLGLVSGEKLDELNSQIVRLEQNLKEAHEAKERAISRAQETKLICCRSLPCC